MRLILLVAALLSSTLAMPTNDIVNEADKKPKHERHKHHSKGKTPQPPTKVIHMQPAWGPQSYSSDPYQDRVLQHHNYHRQNHLAGPLQWDQNLAYTAEQVAKTCIYQHNMQFDPGAGQNIAAGYGPDQIGIVITELFYNHELPMFNGQWYREPDMTYFEQWGHMTQMCWKATTHVGCATHYCQYGLGNVAGGVQPYFTVCQYRSPGNVATEYAQNLSPPQGMAPINGNSF